MKTKDLIRKLTFLGKVVPTNPTLPILENVCFREGKAFTSNLENTIEMHGFDEVKGSGCVPFKALLKAAKAVKCDNVKMLFDEGKFKLEGVEKKREFSFNTHPADEFVKAPECTDKIGRLTETDIETITRAVKFTGNDDLRPVMSGVYLNKEIVATNAHWLGHWEIEGEIKKPFILDKQAAILLKGALITTVTAGKEFDCVCFGLEECKVYSKIIEGKFPDYEAVLPTKDYSHFFEVDRKGLLESLGCALITTNSASKQVRIKLTDNITISSEDVDFENEFEEIIEVKDCKHTQKENSITFGVNIMFLEMILKDIENDTVRFELTEPTRAIKVDDNYIVMPVMLNV